MKTALTSTKYNICLEKPIKNTKKGPNTYYYVIKCANIECNNTINVKPSVWESVLSSNNPRIFSCSMNCKKSNFVKNLLIQKTIETTGFSNPYQNPLVKNKIKQTNLKKYGVENPFQSDIIKTKIKQTNLAKYGCENPQQNKDISNKTKNTRIEKYSNNLQGWAVKSTMIKTNLEKFGNPQFFGSSQGKMSKQNFINLYGELEGLSKYEKWRTSSKQSLEKFIKLYGIKDGNIRYENWVRNSRQNLENFIKRYGKIEGTEKYEIFTKLRLSNLLKNGKNSKLNDFFESLLLEIIPQTDYIREFALTNKTRAGFYFYDFCLFDKILIEVNGDYWHCNPIKYNTGEYVNYIGRKHPVLVDDIWKKDELKKRNAENEGYLFFTFWENDILNNTEKIKNKIKQIINEK
jgi:very-short-patch-repair endonuclease